MANITMGTLYDANKQLMANEKMKPLNELEIAGAQKKLENFFYWKCDCYGMIYYR